MIQLIATVFCFFAAMFWYNSWLKSDWWLEQLFNLWFALIFSGIFLWGVVTLAIS